MKARKEQDVYKALRAWIKGRLDFIEKKTGHKTKPNEEKAKVVYHQTCSL